ncbi:ShlB/FhaC/HecB family hemolysin secretion/activation protein [Sphingomonas solaris]|uniref:ShlB/FhaC/HecB family hemolysin secretion/activation protein n=1 Tax=Alterirhizorhabdus solaris TaxID=2529389 RepID=A0A558QUH1_9SPHN|nr:ShlB/FhaC/HecB family hemolysin secretion/activation protein [Sphingomonas solaris]TVV70800.1 ShlB/FhaC/HecB family hemolysin secretion/activation protein [Sphingomonas solaris]
MISSGNLSCRRGAGFAALAASLAAGASPTMAQVAAQAPVAPPATREEIQRAPIGPDTRAPSRLTVEGGVERAPCPLADPRFADVKVTITAAQFDNLRVVPPEALRPAYESYLGTPQPIAVVCEIRDAAATILRRQGYLAAVQVPAQRIDNGIVRFDVLMAKLVAVQVRGDAGKAERLIAGYLDRLKEQPAFNEREAERYLLLARDLPGYDVRLTLRPAGTAPGEVVGEVTVVRQRIAVDFNAQNYGSRDVGRIGGLLRAEVYDLLGSGDRFSAGLFSTADTSEQQVLQLGYDRRIGSEGLTLSGRFTYAWTTPDIATGAIPVRSRTLVASAEASYPFIRTQALNLRGAFGFDYINQNVRFRTSPVFRNQDHIRVLYARADFDSIDRASLNSVRGYSASEPRWRLAGSLEGRKGLDIFDATDPCPNSACPNTQLTVPSRQEGKPTAALVRLAGVMEFRPSPTITFSLSPRAQYSGRALLSYEEFSGGNYTVGRGYDPGSIIGDSGVGVQAEFRLGRITPQARDAFAFQPYVFYDKAWAWNRNRPFVPTRGRGPNPQDLSSVGGGVRAAYGDRGRIDVSLAKALERGPFQAGRNDARLLVSLTTRLVPWSR